MKKTTTLWQLSKGAEEKVHDLLHTFQNLENTVHLVKDLLMKSQMQRGFLCKFDKQGVRRQTIRNQRFYNQSPPPSEGNLSGNANIVAGKVPERFEG